jgi:hypothetical protein
MGRGSNPKTDQMEESVTSCRTRAATLPRHAWCPSVLRSCRSFWKTWNSQSNNELSRLQASSASAIKGTPFMSLEMENSSSGSEEEDSGMVQKEKEEDLTNEWSDQGD